MFLCAFQMIALLKCELKTLFLIASVTESKNRYVTSSTITEREINSIQSKLVWPLSHEPFLVSLLFYQKLNVLRTILSFLIALVAL